MLIPLLPVSTGFLAGEGNILMSLDIDIRVTTALVSLSSNNLVIMVTKIHLMIPPSIEVIVHVHRSADTLGGTNGPVLLKGFRAINGRLVVTRGNIDVVGSSISVERSLVLCTWAWVIGSVGFDNVVFYEGIAGPAVDGEIAVSGWVEWSTIVDGSESC
jgi:hypothetical protein